MHSTIRFFLAASVATGLASGQATASNALQSVPVEGTVGVTGLAIGAKSAGAELLLKRIEVQAAGAETIVMRATGPEVLPRDQKRWFISADNSLSTRVAIALDADGKRFTGTVMATDGNRALEGTVQGTSLQVTSNKALPKEPESWTCGNQEHGIHGGPPDPAEALAAIARPKGSALHEALIAVDTDNEFLSQKFSGSETAALAYLDQLFALLNLVYERDLDVRLVRGTTILWAVPDPWSQSTTSAQLTEVGTYWRDNRSGVDRAFVAFLSGKSPDPNRAAGIAWLLTSGSYCAAKGTESQAAGHYSVTQVFKFNNSTAANDVLVVGHELGHNLGADHSHCTNTSGQFPRSTNTIDECFNGESGFGCYAGTPSCPSDNSLPNAGSMMSYCHFSAPAGANCANGSLKEFHPVHQGLLDARIATNISNGCLTPTATIPVGRIFYSGFE